MGILKKYLMIGMFVIVMWTSVLAAINYPIKKKLLFGEGMNQEEECEEKMMNKQEENDYESYRK